MAGSTTIFRRPSWCLGRRPGCWPSLSEVPAHTLMVHVWTGSEGSCVDTEVLGELVQNGRSIMFSPPHPPTPTQGLPELPHPLGCPRLPPLSSPRITSSVRSSFPKRQSTVAVSFCLDRYKGKISRFSHVRLFGTPWTVARQAPLSMGILQAIILEWVAMPSSRWSSWPRDQTQVSCIAGGFFIVWATRESFCLEGTLNDLTNFLKLERKVGGGKSLRIQCRVMISWNHLLQVVL